MRIELTRELKARLLKSLQQGYVETFEFPELQSKQGQEFIHLMKEYARVNNNNENSHDNTVK